MTRERSLVQLFWAWILHDRGLGDKVVFLGVLTRAHCDLAELPWLPVIVVFLGVYL